MKKSQLFEYVILWHPTEKQIKEESLKSKIIVEKTTILSSDMNSASMQAAMSIPAEYKDSLEQVDLIIRPF